MNTIIFLFVLIVDVIFAGLFANIAYRKGYPFVSWGVLGFIFPILYLVLLLLPNRYKKVSEKEIIKILEKSKNNIKGLVISLVTVILIFMFTLFANFIIEKRNEQKEKYNDYKTYISSTLAWSYIDLKTNNYKDEFKDEKIYVKDLYDLYVDGYFIDSDEFDNDFNFEDYYLENVNEIKDDYIVIYDLSEVDDQMNAYIDFYSSEDTTNEMKNYINNVVIDKYIKDEQSKNNFTVKLKTLYEKNYISSDYFKKLYEDNKNFSDDRIEVKKAGDNYEKQYFEK